MDIDEQTELARQRALHLAAEVAETDDSNVPVLLLQLKGTLLLIDRLQLKLKRLLKSQLSTFNFSTLLLPSH